MGENIRQINVKRLDAVRKVDIVHFDNDCESEFICARKINITRIPKFTDYLDSYLNMTVNVKYMINMQEPLDRIIYVITNFDIAGFVQYYTNTSVPKMRALGIYFISNVIAGNLIDISDSLAKYYKFEFMPDEVIDDLLDSYKIKNFSLSNVTDNHNFVLKNYSVVNIENVVEPNDKYKGSDVFINIGNGMYKAIPYKTYKRLFKIDYIKISYEIRELDVDAEEEDWIIDQHETDKLLTNPNEIIGYMYGFCNNFRFLNNVLQPVICANVETHINKFKVKFKNGQTKYYKRVHEFVDEFIPGGF